MKKKYDYFANRNNTPHLDTNTRIIRWSWLFLSINSFIFAITDRMIGSMRGGIILGVLFLVCSYLNANDPRKNERSMLAAMLNLTMWFVLTVFGSVMAILISKCYILPIAAVFEAFVLIHFLRGYKKL